MGRARADTYDCLINLRARIGRLLEEDRPIFDAPKVDQSSFSYLKLFEALAGKNA